MLALLPSYGAAAVAAGNVVVFHDDDDKYEEDFCDGWKLNEPKVNCGFAREEQTNFFFF